MAWFGAKRRKDAGATRGNGRLVHGAAEIVAVARARLPGDVRGVLERLGEGGKPAWLVGGSVRDLFLGRPTATWDVATPLRPEEVQARFERTVPTGIAHGTITVIGALERVEVTTFRTEGEYSDARRPDRVFPTESLEEDLARRDLTVNAMALDPIGGDFRDPWGGLADLAAGTLRAVGDPVARFREDGLRPFRAVRLAAELGMEIEEETWNAIPKTIEAAARVSSERIRDELLKILLSERAGEGIERLRRAGLLRLAIPELEKGVGVSQNRWHAYDVYIHSLKTLDAAPRGKLRVRLAALLHDIGKPDTKAVVDGEGTFYNHQHVGAALAREILTRLRLSRDDVDWVSTLVEHHMFHYQADWSDAALRRLIRKVGKDRIADLFDLRLADNVGNGTRTGFPSELLEMRRRIEAILEAEHALHVRDLVVGGEDVMRELGLPPGPAVGRCLDALLEEVLEDPGRNTRELLFASLRAYAEREGIGPGPSRGSKPSPRSNPD